MQNNQTNNSRNSGLKKVCLNHNGFNVDCFFTNTGKIQKKIEHWNGKKTEFSYKFDPKGHLEKVLCNGIPTEQYQYNQIGQRIEQKREYYSASNLTEGYLYYDSQGKLAKAGETSFSYDRKGALSERCDNQGITRFFYGKDTMLDKVVLPSGAIIQYEYGKESPFLPVKRFKNSMLTAEYVWGTPFQLAEYTDYELQLKYTFTYTKENVLDIVYLARLAKNSPIFMHKTDWLENLVAEQRREHLQKLFPTPSTVLKLFCCADQVGTVKIILDKHNSIKKELIHDSFGVLLYDSLPDLFIPIGFAGGLVDKDTNFIRFGWRDYDPTVGRFTALDPLGDTGGDHDLYDYCIDDPVSKTDRNGLFSAWIAKKILTKEVKKHVPSLSHGGFFSPTIANGPEIMMSIERIEKAIEDGVATEDDLDKLKIYRGYQKEFEEQHQPRK